MQQGDSQDALINQFIAEQMQLGKQASETPIDVSIDEKEKAEIADETIDDARKKARRIVTDAEEQAAALEAQSAQKLSEMRADYETLKSKGVEYHKNFSKLVEEQARLLKESPLYAVAEAAEE